MKASKSRVSVENSCFPGGLLLLESAITFELPYRVEPPRMQWMAAEQAFQPHPKAAAGAIFFHGLLRVFRASRMVSAGRRQPRRYRPLVETQNGDDKFARHA